MAKRCDVAVIGGGIAGIAAAIEAADNGGGSVMLFETEPFLGGVLKQCIHSGFGLHTFKEELTGPEYAARFERELEGRGVEVLCSSTVTDLTPGRVLTVRSEEGEYAVEAGAVVISCGCRERQAGAIALPGDRPSGVMTAGTAQRFINLDGYMVGRRAVILGSGDIGLIMARRMALEGAEVLCVCELMPWSNGLNRNIVQCLEDYDIPLRLSTTVVGLEGRARLEGVWLAPVDEAQRPMLEKKEFVPCDTLLLSIGLIPETDLAAEAGAALSPNGGIDVDASRETTVSGVFACGNVVHVHDLVDFVAEEGKIAGAAAAEFAKSGRKRAQSVRTAAGAGVAYVVPQRVTKPDETELFFRVRRPVRGASVVVYSGGREIGRKKRPVMLPGEMERIKVTPDFSGDIRIEIET